MTIENRKPAKALKGTTASRTTVRRSSAKSASAKSGEHVYDTLIVGAGFAGLGTAIKLREAGVHNVAILERAAEVGGTWRDNQYPGAACDIPSNLYSFSFAPNPNWSRSYSGSKEILGYVHSLVNDFGLEKLIQYQQNVTRVELDDAQGIWMIHTDNGQVWKGKTVIMASGPLANASFPKIRGIENFKGKKISPTAHREAETAKAHRG